MDILLILINPPGRVLKQIEGAMQGLVRNNICILHLDLKPTVVLISISLSPTSGRHQRASFVSLGEWFLPAKESTGFHLLSNEKTVRLAT